MSRNLDYLYWVDDYEKHFLDRLRMYMNIIVKVYKLLFFAPLPRYIPLKYSKIGKFKHRWKYCDAIHLGVKWNWGLGFNFYHNIVCTYLRIYNIVGISHKIKCYIYLYGYIYEQIAMCKCIGTFSRLGIVSYIYLIMWIT